jgi:hypothetical protein
MPTVDQATWNDEEPTKKTENVPSRLIVFAARIDRLVEQAIERLQCCPDDSALIEAVASLQQARTLAATVLR